MKFSLDALVVRDNRVFAYGWAFDPDALVVDAAFSIAMGDGGEISLPIAFNKARTDVASAFPAERNALNSGWMIYAAWEGASATGIALAGRLDDGRDFRLVLPLRNSGQAVVPGLRGRFRKIAHDFRAWLGFWGGRVRDPKTAALPSTCDAHEMVKRIRETLASAGQLRCSLVIDHDMGGGANHFRREWVLQRLVAREVVLLLTFDTRTLSYVVDIVTRSSVRRLVVGGGEPATALADSGLVDEVFYNDAVSFPEPEVVPGWLTRFKSIPGTALSMAVHDYFAVCPSQFLLNDAGRFCRIPAMAECLRCLPLNRNEFSSLFASRSMPAWRDKWLAALSVADKILCFSQSSRDLLIRAYPLLNTQRISITPHAVEPFDRRPVVDLRAPLQIGVVGAIGVHKGSLVIEGLANEISRRRLDVKIKVIGVIDLPVPSQVIHSTGPYSRDDLPALIESSGANIFLMPSICPETFSYVTQELMALNLPLVSFDFGAPAERVGNYSLGRVLPLGSASELLDHLLVFHRDIGVRRNISPLPVKDNS